MVANRWKCAERVKWGRKGMVGKNSWKNCTGFPFQNVLSIKSLVCVSVL